MWLINTALIRPFTILVAVIAIALCSILAYTRMPVDIFPNLNLPVIYVAQPYGGMDPAQMEGLLTNYYEYHFLYIGGIHHVESKNIQGVALMKLGRWEEASSRLCERLKIFEADRRDDWPVHQTRSLLGGALRCARGVIATDRHRGI